MNPKHFIYSFFVFFLLASSNQANAQETKLAINFGPEALIPLGETAGLNDFSYGGSLQVVYTFRPKIHFTATAAYQIIKPSKQFVELWEPWGYEFEDAVFMPVKGGVKYDLSSKFFIAADAGISIPKDSFRSKSFAYSASVGTNFAMANGSAIQISAKYENWALNLNSYSNFIGLRAAYAIPILKK